MAARTNSNSRSLIALRFSQAIRAGRLILIDFDAPLAFGVARRREAPRRCEHLPSWLFQTRTCVWLTLVFRGLRLKGWRDSAQHPGRPVIAPEKFAGFIVAEDAFFFGVPLDLSANEHGDQAEVARDGGMVCRLNWGDRGLVRLYAVQEIAVMIA